MNQQERWDARDKWAAGEVVNGLVLNEHGYWENAEGSNLIRGILYALPFALIFWLLLIAAVVKAI